MALDLSVEPKSTTMSSKSLKVWPRMLSIDSARNWSTLHVTMTTETKALSIDCRLQRFRRSLWSQFAFPETPSTQGGGPRIRRHPQHRFYHLQSQVGPIDRLTQRSQTR